MSIKIEGPNSLSGTQRARGPGKAASAGGSEFSSHLTEDTAKAGSAVSAGGMLSIESLIGLQEVDDALAKRKKARQRGFDILDRLDELRLAILEGRVSKDRLISLTQMVQARRANVDDPALAELLDEIDLRAQVELAKLTPA